jgi:hypothetical protein
MTRWRLAWLDPDGKLLPDQPLRLAVARNPQNPSVELSAESRLAGRLRLDRAAEDWQWQRVATFEIPAGLTLLYNESAGSGEAYFRAQLQE